MASVKFFDDVEAVGALRGLGRAKRSGFRILPAAISADHEKVWVLTHPIC